MEDKYCLAGFHQLARAVQIGIVGNHPIKIVPSFDDGYDLKHSLDHIEEITTRLTKNKIKNLNIVSSGIAITSDYMRLSESEIVRISQKKFNGTDPNLETLLEEIKLATPRESVSRDLSAGSEAFLKRAVEKLGLSKAKVDFILDVAVTIASLSRSTELRLEFIAESVCYQNSDTTDTTYIDTILQYASLLCSDYMKRVNNIPLDGNLAGDPIKLYWNFKNQTK